MEISVMGKKMKLKLDEIKVESFVTALTKEQQMDLAGGLPPVTEGASCDRGTLCTYCPSRELVC
jgi:hypothetical protein